MIIKLDVNDQVQEIDIEPYETLLEVLRDRLGLTGARRGCDAGGCGACTVLLDGKAVYSCGVFAAHAEGKKVMTIEGLAKDGKLHPIQEAFIKYGALQCGFCTPGMILAAKSLLDRNPNPTEGQIREGIAGNICRCTGYVKIVQAVSAAAETMREGARK